MVTYLYFCFFFFFVRLQGAVVVAVILALGHRQVLLLGAADGLQNTPDAGSLDACDKLLCSGSRN